MVIEPRFADAGDFSEGLARVQLEEGGKWGYIDRAGTVIIQPRFVYADDFSEGLAAVAMESRDWGPCGFIDVTGAFVILPQYKQAGSFSNGVALVQPYVGPSVHIDISGKVISQETRSGTTSDDGAGGT